MCTGVNTHMSKRTHLHMHWCSRHLFSACHTHHNTCTWQHLHIHAYADSMTTTSPWKLLRTIRESWDCILCHWWYKETYWVELETRPKHPTQNMLGELPRLSHSPRTPPHPTRSYLFTVSLPPHKSPSKFTRAHDAVAATLPYKRHLMLCISVIITETHDGCHPLHRLKTTPVFEKGRGAWESVSSDQPTPFINARCLASKNVKLRVSFNWAEDIGGI